MIDNVLVDTNILIDYTKGGMGTLKEWLSKQAKNKVNLKISPISVAEFLNDQTLTSFKMASQAEEFLGLFEVTEISRQVGVLAGKLLREKQSEYIGDSMIAASCVLGKMQLLTRNKKHFRSVKELKFA